MTNNTKMKFFSKLKWMLLVRMTYPASPSKILTQDLFLITRQFLSHIDRIVFHQNFDFQLNFEFEAHPFVVN